MLDLTRCKTLHLRLSTTLSSCQTTKLYFCLVGIKQLVLRILHLQRKGKRQPKETVYMCPLVMDLISLFDFLTSSRGGKAYLHLNSCEGQSMGSLILFQVT